MAIFSLIILGGAAVLGAVFVDETSRKQSGSKPQGKPHRGPQARQEPRATDQGSSATRRFGSLLPRGERARLNPEQTQRELNQLLKISVASATARVVGLAVPAIGLLAVPGAIYVTIPVWRDAWVSLTRDKRVNFYVLYSVAQAMLLGGGMFFLSALDNALFYAAEKLAHQSRGRARESLTDVFITESRTAFVELDNTTVVEVAVESIEVGQCVVVSAGQIIPVDGSVREGIGRVDQHILTGESMPVCKQPSDRVFAGTLVVEGKISILVAETGEETVAAQLATILSETTNYLSGVQLRGEQLADKTALPVLTLSAVSAPFVGYVGATAMLFSGIGDTVRITAPLTLLDHLKQISEGGVLIKDGRSLELLSSVDTFVFDKTGTLTSHIPRIASILVADGHDPHELLAVVAAAESYQSHPIARAIVDEALGQNLALPEVEDCRCVVGFGIEATIRGRAVRIGSKRFMQQSGVNIPPEIEAQLEKNLYSAVFVARDEQLAGVIELQASVRPETATVLANLKRRGLSLVLLSGDRQAPTEHLADQLGIDRVYAEMLPGQKADIIDDLQREGRCVCFVGDGLNDSVALKKANISISLSGASSLAVDTAGIILMDGTLRHLPQLLDQAKMFDDDMRRNFAISIVPGVGIIMGALFFHIGVPVAILVYNLGLIGGVSNVMFSRRRSPEESS